MVGGLYSAVLLFCTAAPLQPDCGSGDPPPRRTAYVIASEDRFNDGRVDKLRRALQYTFIRVDPFSTTNQECSLSPNEEDGRVRGIFFAHRNVWSAIALSADPSARSLVLESDFSVGNSTDAELRERMDAAFARADEDMTSVGWCDLCAPGGERQANAPGVPCYGCATGYIMHPSYARALVGADFCMAADTALVGACSQQDADWAISLQQLLGRPMSCSFEHVPGYTQGSWFRGTFQQDLKHYAGSHNGRRSESPERRRLRKRSRTNTVLANECGVLGSLACAEFDESTGWTSHWCTSEGHDAYPVGAVPHSDGTYHCEACGRPNGPACECTHDNPPELADNYKLPCVWSIHHWCRFEPQYIATVSAADGLHYCIHNVTGNALNSIPLTLLSFRLLRLCMASVQIPIRSFVAARRARRRALSASRQRVLSTRASRLQTTACR